MVNLETIVLDRDEPRSHAASPIGLMEGEPIIRYVPPPWVMMVATLAIESSERCSFAGGPT